MKMDSEEFHAFLKMLMQSKQYGIAKLFVEDLKGNALKIFLLLSQLQKAMYFLFISDIHVILNKLKIKTMFKIW